MRVIAYGVAVLGACAFGIAVAFAIVRVTGVSSEPTAQTDTVVPAIPTGSETSTSTLRPSNTSIEKDVDAASGTASGRSGAEVSEASGASDGSGAATSASNLVSSGNDELDAAVAGLVDEWGIDLNSDDRDAQLETCFHNVALNYSYVEENEYPEGDWTVWSQDYALEMATNGQGNCYRFASLFCWVARALGYDASVVSGEVASSDSESGFAAHGWVQIERDGTSYVCDLTLSYARPDYNWFMNTYEDAPISYYYVDDRTPIA